MSDMMSNMLNSQHLTPQISAVLLSFFQMTSLLPEVLHFEGDLTGAKGYAEDAVKLSVSQRFFVGEIHGNP